MTSVHPTAVVLLALVPSMPFACPCFSYLRFLVHAAPFAEETLLLLFVLPFWRVQAISKCHFEETDPESDELVLMKVGSLAHQRAPSTHMCTMVHDSYLSGSKGRNTTYFAYFAFRVSCRNLAI